MFKKSRSGSGSANGSQVETIIGEGTHFKGSLTTQGSLRVDGQVEGEVKADGDLLVGGKGRIEARVQARNLAVAGYLQGDVELSGTMEIETGGRVLGDVEVENLVVHDGGKYQGTCRMEGAETESSQAPAPAALPAAEEGQ